jgi:hypothetical protein
VVPFLVNQARELQRQSTPGANATSLDVGNLQEPVAQAMGYFVTADGDYNWRLGRLFEQLVMYFGRKIAVVIDHGWRYMPIPPLGAPTVLAVGVHHVSLTQGGVDDAIDIRLELDRPTGLLAQTARGTNARAQTPFAHHSDEELYFPSSTEELNGDTPVPGLSVICDLAGSPAVGHFSLADLDKVGYRGEAVSLLGVDGSIVARCYVDARLLTNEQVQSERLALETWDENRKVALANALGEITGQVLAKAFGESESIAAEAREALATH